MLHYQISKRKHWEICKHRGAASLFFAPSIVTAEQQAEWEQYAAEHAAYAGISENIFIRPIEAGIYRLGQTNYDRMDDTSIPNSTTNRKLPIWQINPSEEKRHLNMLNLDSIIPNAFNFSNAKTETPLFGNILDDYTANYVRDGGNNSSLEDSSTPRSFTVLPILNAAADGDDNDIVLGITGAEIEWITLFDNVVPDAPTVCIVLENTCGQVHTYLVKEGNRIASRQWRPARRVLPTNGKNCVCP
ncbi:hypothetical protein MHU86_21692 [Fragilaria crotonensis]|nr:hypothetical protein MHU86_21692 [Fragilaria crotonensis]